MLHIDQIFPNQGYRYFSKHATNWTWKFINQPACSEEREEEYERAKRRIFNEMMSPAPHYKYSISLGGTKVSGILLIFSGIWKKNFEMLYFVYLLERICLIDYTVGSAYISYLLTCYLESSIQSAM